MTTTTAAVATPPAETKAARRKRLAERGTRSLASPMALRSARGRFTYWLVFAVMLIGFVAAFLFPIYWMITGAMKSTPELVSTTPTLVPQHWHPGNYATAWSDMDLGQYLTNTVIQAGGAWLLQIVLCTAAAYALSKLRPIFGQVILGGILATLMVPTQALVVPKYLTALDLPLIHANLLNSPLAVWLPAAANAFNLYLLKRFFDQIPNDLMEAAGLDGAGPLRTLWYIVLPMARPVLGVVSIFAVVAVWQDFLWPLLVFTDGSKQPITVGVEQLAANLPLNETLAALVLASAPLVAVFLVFQRHIIAGLGAGSVKG